MTVPSVLLRCLLLAAALFLLGRPPQSWASPPEDKTNPKLLADPLPNARLSSVLVRDEEVFAASADGLFRAALRDRQWSRLPMPEGMPAGGAFADTPNSSRHLLYFAPTFPRDEPNPRRGLYGSSDGGMTWRLVSGDHDFQHVFLHRDGALYAIVLCREKEEDRTILRWRILRAPALAAPPQWADITGEIGAGVMLDGIFEDPDHARLVCLHGECGRGYVIHAEDNK